MKFSDRVVITGMGIVCAVGDNIEKFNKSIQKGVCGIRNVERFSTATYHAHIAGEVGDVNLRYKPRRIKPKYLGRTVQLLLKAGVEAIDNARLDFEKLDRSRIGIVLGTSLGELKSGETIHHYWKHRGSTKIRPSLLVTFPIYKPLDILALEFGIHGPKSLISTACASSTNSIGYACDLIRRGKADVMITGGVDPLSKLSYAGFDSLLSLSQKPCAPFSRQAGLSLGEGAGILILERLDHAMARQANIHAEVLGYGLSGDAYHSTAPDLSGQGPMRAIKFALENAGLSCSDIDYVNAHGTGTRFNDATETKAIKLALGDHAFQIPVSSLKSMVGHTLGASGALEAIASVLCIEKNFVFPTVNFVEPADGCDLDYVPNKSRSKNIRTVLSNSFGFGGNNAVVAISRFNDERPQQPLYRNGHRVVITGMGIINPAGIGVDAFWENLIAGKSGIRDITSFDTSMYSIRRGGEIRDFNPKDFIHPSRLRRMDRLSHLATASTQIALRNSGLEITNDNCHRIGIVFGTGTGPMDSIMGTIEEVYAQAAEKKLLTVSPARFMNTVFNAAAGHVSIEFKIKGPNSTIAMGSVSSANALCYAYDLLKLGYADSMIAVSSDEIGESLLLGYSALGVLAQKANGVDENSRPFDLNRNGFVISEGGAALVLETLENARKRDAYIWGEIMGYGMTSGGDCFYRNSRNGEPLSRAMKIALQEASASPDAVDCIFADANSSRDRDVAETNAIKKLFDARAYSLPISAIKSMTGEPDGGGAMNAIIAGLMAMHEGKIPPTINYRHADKECDLDYVPNVARNLKIERFLVNSSSYGGANNSILIGKYE